MTKELDSKDWKILYQLCTDARLSHSKIGKLVGLSKNSVTYRIERLEKKGIITGYFTIVNHMALGSQIYTVLLKLNVGKEKEAELIDYLKSNKNTMVVDKLLGEWDLLVEHGSHDPSGFNLFISELKAKFSGIIDTYEVHSTLDSYKVEQLPVELVKEVALQTAEKTEKAVIDKTDSQLLVELSKDSTATLFELAEKLGVTYETVSARIKKLRESKVIIKTTAKIGLGALGYDVYFIRLNLRNFSKEREGLLKAYLLMQKNIRYSFLSGFRPTIFIYLAVKKAAGLDSFLASIKERFADIIISQNYMLATGLIKYNLFPEGFIAK